MYKESIYAMRKYHRLEYRSQQSHFFSSLLNLPMIDNFNNVHIIICQIFHRLLRYNGIQNDCNDACHEDFDGNKSGFALLDS